MVSFLERLKDRRPLHRRQFSWRVFVNASPACLSLIFLFWGFFAHFFVFIPLLIGEVEAQRRLALDSDSFEIDANPTTVTASPKANTPLGSTIYGHAPGFWIFLTIVVFSTDWTFAIAHFFRTFLTDNCPASYIRPHDSSEEEGKEQHNYPSCQKCHGVKPERCHHCSLCGRCCLKMDHHCLF